MNTAMDKKTLETVLIELRIRQIQAETNSAKCVYDHEYHYWIGAAATLEELIEWLQAKLEAQP